MTESQSRYGIMKELTDRKNAVIAELAQLEKNYDNTIFNVNKDHQTQTDAISDKKQNYKIDFQNWKHSEELKITMKERENQRIIEGIKASIAEKEANYAEEATNWLKIKEAELAEQKRGFTQWKKNTETEIATKKAILKELDAAMKDLKEISKEQKEKT